MVVHQPSGVSVAIPEDYVVEVGGKFTLKENWSLSTVCLVGPRAKESLLDWFDEAEEMDALRYDDETVLDSIVQTNMPHFRARMSSSLETNRSAGVQFPIVSSEIESTQQPLELPKGEGLPALVNA